MIQGSRSISRRTFNLSFAALATTASRVDAKVSPDLAVLTVSQANRGLRAESFSATDLVRACLERIDLINSKVNAFITVTGHEALAQAALLDAEAKSGRWRGPLHGIPIALKDNIDTAGVRTTAGSAVFDDRVPEKDAVVVTRLRAAGAIIIGKTNLHELAFGGSSATSYFGPVRNPWALDRMSGGSSGGSAVAVATGMCLAAIGTDTGGSIRTPASFCGVSGLKPTYGLVPIRGIVPLAVSLDHCGPICRTAEDAAFILNVIAGHDPADVTSIQHVSTDYLEQAHTAVHALRIGIPRYPFFDMLDPDIAKAIDQAITCIQQLTAGVKDVTLPPTSAVNDDAIIGAEELAFHEEQFKRFPSRYMRQQRGILSAAQSIPAAEYVRSCWRLAELRRTVDQAFSDFDLVLLPTRRHAPRTLASTLERESSDKPRDPENDNTPAFDAYGIPALSIPCGFGKDGLPIGLMIAGPHFSEGKVLALARAYQEKTDWHLRRPPIDANTAVPPLPAIDDRFR